MKLLDLEQPLIDLKNMAGLLGHLSTSEREVTGQELAHIQTVLSECHEDLQSWWDDACHNDDQEPEEVAILREELAAGKASRAAPGSEEDVGRAKTSWWLLVSAARTVLEEAREAGMMPDAKTASEEGEDSAPQS